MSRRCSCPAGYRHQQLGKERKELAAEYPADLCREYAELVIKTGKHAVVASHGGQQVLRGVGLAGQVAGIQGEAAAASRMAHARL